MVNCRKCGSGVGCDCNLISGLCNGCYYGQQVQGNPAIAKKVVDASCSQTLSSLTTLLNSLNERVEKTDLVKYQKSILRSQIAQYDKDPCKYKIIIDNIT